MVLAGPCRGSFTLGATCFVQVRGKLRAAAVHLAPAEGVMLFRASISPLAAERSQRAEVITSSRPAAEALSLTWSLGDGGRRGSWCMNRPESTRFGAGLAEMFLSRC